MITFVKKVASGVLILVKDKPHRVMKSIDAPHFKYCPMCGRAMVIKCPIGDVRLREICEGCGYIHYINPIPVVGTIPVMGDKVLLCKRAIEPRKGKWTLPAGFMEAHETLLEGALRETYEETGAYAEGGELFTVIDVPYASQIHFFFLSLLDSFPSIPGPETQEQALFSEDDIPWDEISFTTVKSTLRHFFEDRRKGGFQLHRYRLDD